MLEARGREVRLTDVQGGTITLAGGQLVSLNCQNKREVGNSKTLFCNNDSI